MSILEQKALDLTDVLLHAYDIADMIKSSKEVEDYLSWKEKVANHSQVHSLKRELARKKDLFEECQRFGHFHPDYHRALDEVNTIQNQINEIPEIQAFKEAEDQLDDLLYQVSQTIAFAVSTEIKVPSNNPLPVQGCGSGGSCSGGCG